EQGVNQIMVRNNVLQGPVILQREGSYADPDAANVCIVNNTIVNSLNDACLRLATTGQLNVNINNNILHWAYPDGSAQTGTGFLAESLSSLTSVTIDHNLYFLPAVNSTRVARIASTNYSLSSWQAAGYEPHSIVGNPLYVDQAGGDFRISAM